MSKRWLIIICLGIASIVTIVVAYAGLAVAVEKNNINVQSTRQYLSSEHRALQAFIADLPNARHNVDHMIYQIRRGCTDAALGVPSNENTLRVTEEIALLIIASVEKTEMRVTGDFLHAIAGLKWSSRAIVQTVSVMQRTFVSQAALMMPNLCTDIQFWRKSGFQKFPGSTVEFVHRATEESATPVDTRHLLVQYERADEHGVLSAIKRLRHIMNHELTMIVISATYRIRNIVGLRREKAGVGLLSIPPPAAIKRVGGLELHEFEAGARVAAQSGCLACHRIGIQGNAGPGPSLDHVGSRLTEPEIERAILNAKEPMPSFRRLPKAKFRALVKFLRLLR